MIKRSQVGPMRLKDKMMMMCSVSNKKCIVRPDEVNELRTEADVDMRTVVRNNLKWVW